MNRQSIRQYKQRPKPRQKKIKQPPRSNKVEVNGMMFDSETEYGFYVHLKTDKTVKEIELQPRFEIIPAYEVECKRCKGAGRVVNVATGNLNKCRRCKLGCVKKAATHYTADFKVTYIDGYIEFIDVKGYKAERDFPLRKTLFERNNGIELIVVRWDKEKKAWKRE